MPAPPPLTSNLHWHGTHDVICNKTPTSAVGDGPASSRIRALSLRETSC